ncbi:DUF1588 domain-containing protein [Myxococcota bacterium]|nr:DUF1588 domain-containing protein [Myxococcota bacterium]
MLMFLSLWACGLDETVNPITPLGAREQLLRLSVDLRGVHPSEEELLAIEAAAASEDPAAFDETYTLFADRYLYDPRFLGRVEELFNHSFRTRTGDVYFDLEEVGLGYLGDERAARSIGDEPLKLIRYVAEHDLPYTELVTADYTVADPTLATLWDLELQDPDADGWQRARYRDGREHAGVLSMTSLWLRYPSAGVNANRHRANTVTRVLLCDDYLARPVSFSRSQIDALTSGDPEDVIRDTPTCQSCHSSLDPIASHFFGFWWEIEGDLTEQTLYRPEDEEIWKDHHNREPGYFGKPTANLAELGMLLAEDTRLVDCAVKTVFEGVTQRATSEADWAELTDAELAARLPTVKQVSPTQLASIIEDITGYAWTFDGREGLSDQSTGLPVLAGGIDSRYVTTPNHDPSVGLVFIQERLAQSAGRYVAEHDLDPNREGDALMLQYVTVLDTPESNPAAFEAQIRDLLLRVRGVPLAEDATEPARLMALWKQLYSAEGSAERAWAGVVSVALRDPRILFY